MTNTIKLIFNFPPEKADKLRMRGVCKVLIFIFLSQTALAIEVDIPQSECGKVDIREGKSEEVKKHFSTPMDLSSNAWCYSVVAADLLSAEVDRPVSSYHVAAVHNRKVQEDFWLRLTHKLNTLFGYKSYDEVLEGGWVDEALKGVIKRGKICAKGNLSGVTYTAKIRNIIEGLESIKKDHKEKRITNAKACRKVKNHLSLMLDLRNRVNEIATSLLTKNLNKTFEDLLDKTCTQDTEIKNLDVKSLDIPSKEINHKAGNPVHRQNKMDKMFKTLNEHLSKGKPLGLDYELGHVTKGKGFHSNTIIGRRWKNGKCQYKLRDSQAIKENNRAQTKEDRWKCDLKDKSISCNPQDGTYWLSGEKLQEIGMRIHYLE